MAKAFYALISFYAYLFLAGTTPAPEWVQTLGAVVAALMYYLATRRHA